MSLPKTHTNGRTFHSIRTVWFVQTAVMTTLTVFLLLITAFLLARNELTSRTTSQLLQLATSKEDLLQSVIARQREQISLLAAEPTLVPNERVKRLLGITHLIRVSSGSMIDVLFSEHDEDVLPRIQSFIASDTSIGFSPLFTEHALDAYLIAVPTDTGLLIGLFDAQPLLSLVLGSDSANIDIALSFIQNGNVYIIRPSGTDGAYAPLFIGLETDASDTIFVRAIHGEETILQTQDYAGLPIFAATRSAPSVGWGITASIDRYEALSAVKRLTATMFAGGFLIIIFAILVAQAMARRITSPLLELTKKLGQLETKNWKFSRSIYTSNEIEIVDAAAFDLAKRLRESYAALERKVRDRTKELAGLHAQDEAILSSMDYGVVVTDLDGKIVMMNASAQELCANKNPAGLSYASVLPLIDKNGNQLLHAAHPIGHVLETKTGFIPLADPEFSIATAKQLRSISIVATPIMQKKTLIGVVAVLRDTTESRRVDKMKSEFISLASHQLRTPLSSARWHSEMLLDNRNLNAEELESVKEINIAAERMARLLASLLDVTNLELGTSEKPKAEIITLHEFFANVEKSFENDVKKKLIKLAINVDAISIQSDPLFMRLIFDNIVGNAIKYSRDGGTITINAQQSQDRIIITVADNGIGVPANQKHRIFEKLFRADNARQSDTDGNGLGLYIAKLAADNIGATITFESETDIGTTFTITVPA